VGVATCRYDAAVPFIFYEDVARAIAWLERAFGFEKRFALEGPNGIVLHAELLLGASVVMVGGLGPRNAGPPPDRVRSGTYVFVDGVDAHCEIARAAGAAIVIEPTDQPYGDRYYLATDPEGHEWYVAQHMRDVSIDELQRGLPR
jgi:uncharacterized glyoxalase superfamily protein PhnB